MNGEPRAFVDTNVIVYALTEGGENKHEIARRLLRSLLEEGRACISTQVLQETFVTLTRKAGIPADAATGDVRDLSHWPVFVVDSQAVLDACNLAQAARVSFWDALMISAAVRMRAEVLYTEDLNHGQVVSGVRIVNPFISDDGLNPR